MSTTPENPDRELGSDASMTPAVIARINAECATESYRFQRCVRWSEPEIDRFTTDEIFGWLRSFGVDLDASTFIRQVAGRVCAHDLAEHWWVTSDVSASGYDEDFLWMAASVLWRRLAPETPPSEDIVQWMTDGRKARNADELGDVCSSWARSWEGIKSLHTRGCKSIDDINDALDSRYPLEKWCRDYELALAGIGLKIDRQLLPIRLEYCREFATLFPDADESLLREMGIAEAETLILLGREEEGAVLFQKLTEQFPKDPWPWIFWGDLRKYRIGPPSPREMEQAEELYGQALRLAKGSERRVVRDRIEELQPKTVHTDFNVVREETDVDDDDYCGPAKTPKLLQTQSARRNDPCPCGSGRKYKKCCGGAR